MQLAKQATQPALLSYSAALQQRHEAATLAEARKERGQVFTPPSVCGLMAGLFTQIPDRFRLLDAGAGVGSLAAAVCERVLSLRSPRQIEIVLYETTAPCCRYSKRTCNIAARPLTPPGTSCDSRSTGRISS